MSSSATGTSRCAACRNQRRRCPTDCIFSPHFPSTDPERFDAVHRIYGASKVAKMLEEIPPEMRGPAANALHFEAKCRIRDPVYGCVGIISTLNEEIRDTGTELAKLRARVAFLASGAQERQLGQDYTIVDDHWTEQQQIGNVVL
ncbi:hypothetical protein MLD38_024859 [Melastoma candidum]|uniref:Uncharacterized protein n=1 Tax=Melastoma candidum TaxID=119954 RepID=A0ACB9NWF5_9MYRT|nr:hypothetical protein MLD38_024859 [Melastoma candidum]